MFDIILQVLAYSKLLITFSLFTYIYKYFYDSCSEKKVIKSKNEKPKKVIKTRIGLALTYFFLLTSLYFSLTWYIFLTLLLAIFTVIITLSHKFEPSTLDLLKKYDSHPITKKIWYFYSLIMNIIFKIMGPCHRVLENKINKNKEKIKNGLMSQASKMNFNGLNMGFLGSLSTFSDNTGNSVIDVNSNNKKKINSNKKDMVDEFNKLEHFFKNKNDKIIKLNSKSQDQTSELNKYILEDYKTKSIKLKNYEKQNAKIIINDSINDFNNIGVNNNFAAISDIEEPLDIILLNKQKTINKKEQDNNSNNNSNNNNNINNNNSNSNSNGNIEDFYNKMKTIEKKVNKNTVIIADDDLSSFINKTEMFNQENNYDIDSDDITSNNMS
jgi:hypothetical protein